MLCSFRATAITTLAITSLLALGGCAPSALTAPPVEAARAIEDTAAPPGNTLTATSSPKSGGTAPLPSPQTASWNVLCEKWVHRDEKMAMSGGRYTLRFYDGSLKTDQLITVRDYDSDVIDVQLGPQGTKFGTPVELSIDFSRTAIDAPRAEGSTIEPVLYWLDDSTGQWVVVPGMVDWANHRYVARLAHFSRYVLGGKAGWKHTPPTDGD